MQRLAFIPIYVCVSVGVSVCVGARTQKGAHERRGWGWGMMRVMKYMWFESRGENTGVGLRGVERREMGRGRGRGEG